MRHWDLYNDQLARRKNGIRFDTAAEYLSLGLKSGKFCENAIAEVAGSDFVGLGPQVRIPRSNGRYFTADGFLPDLGCYIESKNYSFYSTGTASEKLPNFLVKLEEYDKPALIIFGGEHELLNDEPSRLIWDAFHNGSSSSGVINAMVNFIRPKIRDIIGLSELRGWLEEARREAR